MADTGEQQQVMLEEANLGENTHIVTVADGSVVDTEEVSEDILQQALEEASEGFDHSTVEYVTAESVVADGTAEQIVEANTVSVADAADYTTLETDVSQTHNIVAVEQQAIPHTTTSQILSTEQTGPPTITVLTNEGGEPLGSSENPIRIIQQGNQYTSVQQLTPEQLAQIMQVVQEQQLARSAQQGGGSSVLFNPQTQTRIVYRVIYPSELHSKGIATGGVGVVQSGVRPQVQVTTQRGGVESGHAQKRTYRKRQREEDDRLEGPELSKEEKDERKKHRPRTRSGRVSKPPKHMVKDYKHIHVLDWDEDYDDSDGGYSDYHVSDEEGEEGSEGRGRRRRDGPYIQPGLGTAKPKNFKCETCEKAYIGRAGLGRHYRLNPGHGVLEDEPDDPANITTNGLDESQLESGNSNSSTGSTIPVPGSTVASAPATARVPVASVTLASTTAAKTAPNPHPVAATAPKSVLKTKQAYMQDNTPARRKSRLKELVRQSEDEELMEIVLPRLAKVITVWEFLMMKVEKGRPLKPHFPDVYREFETLHRQVYKMCQEYLRPAPAAPASVELATQGDQSSNQSNRLQITNQVVAQSLGLSVGSYVVRDVTQEEESAFQYKYLTTDPTTAGTVQNTKREIELVSADELVVHPPKRRAVVAASQPRESTVPVQHNVSASDEPEVEPPAMESVDDAAPAGSPHNDQQQLTENQTTAIVTSSGQIVQVATPTTVQVNGMVIQNGHVATENENNETVEGMAEGEMEGEVIGEENGTQVLVQAEDEVTEMASLEQEQIIKQGASILQTADGTVFIQNPDGSTFQLQGHNNEAISLETVQALLAMESEGQAHVEHIEETTDQ